MSLGVMTALFWFFDRRIHITLEVLVDCQQLPYFSLPSAVLRLYINALRSKHQDICR